VVLPGKIDDLLAARRDGLDFDIDAIDTPIGMHVQLRDKAAADQADPDFRHCRKPPVVHCYGTHYHEQDDDGIENNGPSACARRR
jgi:hypothetical protein